MAGPVVRISEIAGGLRGGGASSPQFLADGHTVAYAANNGGYFSSDIITIYARDLIGGQLAPLSTRAFVGYVSDVEIAQDGRTAAFVNQRTFDTAPPSGLYTQDLATGTLTTVTTTTGTITPRFSPNGTKIVFVSDQSDLVPGDTNGAADVFVKDLINGGVTRISTAADGSPLTPPVSTTTTKPISAGIQPLFTADGTKVVFSSAAPNLVPGDTDGRYDVFVKDLATGSITRVTGATDFRADAVSADGSSFYSKEPSPLSPSTQFPGRTATSARLTRRRAP